MTEERRVFVRASLVDNPHLDSGYVETLQNLDPLTRQRLLDGDWDAVPDGGMFKRDWFPIVELDQVPRKLKWYRFWDCAATAPEAGKDPDYTCGCLIAQRKGVWWVRDMARFRLSAQGVEKRIRRQAEIDGRGVAIRMEQEPGSSGKALISYYQREVLPGFDFKGIRSTGKKTDRAAPLASAAEAGNVILVSGGRWITDFLDEIAAFPQGSHDDQVDALSGGFDCALYKPYQVKWLNVRGL